MKPVIALVGRPNVGKSTLFNRLVGRKMALVDDQPGVTRDMREGEVRIGDLTFTVMDTAGLDDGRKDELASRMEEKALAAARKADLIFFIIDARSGFDTARQAAGGECAQAGQAGAAHRQQGGRPRG